MQRVIFLIVIQFQVYWGGFSIKSLLDSVYLCQEYPKGTYYLKKDFNTFDLSRLQELIKEKISKNNIEIKKAEINKKGLEGLNAIIGLGPNEKSKNTEEINTLSNDITKLRYEEVVLERYLKEMSDNLNRVCNDSIQEEMANKNADIASFIEDFVNNITNASVLKIPTIDDLKKQLVNFNNNKEKLLNKQPE